MRTSSTQPYKNLFDIYDACFDPAIDNPGNDAKYVEDYVSNGLGGSISTNHAELVAETRQAWLLSDNKSQNQFFYKVQKPLEAIEISPIKI